MFLYNYTLVPPAVSVASVIGQFTDHQQLVVATAACLETWRQNDDKLEKLASQYSFGTIQAVDKIRPLGFTKDLLLITSDSGCITLCELLDNLFVPLFQEPHSKNRLNGSVPGEYLNVDPKNRAIMISSLQKRKFLYKLHVDDGVVSLSSPLEAKGGVTIDTCAIDNGYNNPKFAALEIEGTQTVLNWYELDQGLNYVSKTSEKVPESANLLVPYKDSVIICCDGFLQYNHQEIASKGRITSYVVHKLKSEDFILLQNEFGQLLKFEEKEVKFFGNLPVCHDLRIFKNGFLYANVINDSKQYCQIVGLDTTSNFEEELENLEIAQTIETLDPILDLQLTNEKIVTAGLSSVRTLTHAAPTSVIVESPLPLSPVRVFTTKLTADSANDEYLVLSSLTETLVLSIGEVVEEVPDSKFSKEPTLLVQQVGKASLVQVYPNGVKHINNGKVTDWYPPGGISIIRASSTSSQLVIALSNNEIVYFEVDVDDQLIEYQKRLEMATVITSIALSKAFVVVGCADESIQVVSVSSHNCFEILSLQMLSSNASSVAFFGASEVHIGMESGLFVRTTVDIKGKLSNSRTKYVGTAPVMLRPLNDSTMMIISSKKYVYSRKLIPIEVDVQDGTSFYSEDIGGEGVVGFKGKELIIFTIDEMTDFIVGKDDISGRKLLGGVVVGEEVVIKGESVLKLEPTEVSLCVCEVQKHILIGTTKHIYTFFGGKILHKTVTDGPCRAIVDFNGQILVAIDNNLRIYEIGQKQLLKKFSSSIRNKIIKMVHQGKNRLVIGDSKNSTIFLKFVDGKFIEIAEDTMNRQITALTTLDYDTVIGGDKFGNVFVNRITKDNDYFVEDSYLNGASGRVKSLAEFYLNDVPMQFAKGTLIIGGEEVVVYGGLSGTIGVLLPISEADYKFLTTLTLELNKDLLLNRDSVKHRSYYNMTHNVVDGDLIETFLGCDVGQKIRISTKVGKSVREIENKIMDFRDKSAF